MGDRDRELALLQRIQHNPALMEVYNMGLRHGAARAEQNLIGKIEILETERKIMKESNETLLKQLDELQKTRIHHLGPVAGKE